MIIVDGHCDTLLELYNKKKDFYLENLDGHIDFPRLKKGKVNLQFFAIYIEPAYKPYGALCRTLEILDYFNSLNICPVLYKEDLFKLNTKKTMALLSIEGGEALERKLSSLRILFNLGIRALTITWNQRNFLADGTWEKDTAAGLTSFGKAVIEEMNNLGMVIDVSHIAERGFWDIIDISKKPIIASHSCCRSLYDHPRNLTDKQLKALGNNNGVVGINFYPGFLGKENVTIQDVLNHIEYAVEMAGLNHVGIGSDYDGIDCVPKGLEDVSKMPSIFEGLIKRGWKDEDAKKVLGGNFIRVLQENLPSKEGTKKD